jgi:hypothetical protein
MPPPPQRQVFVVNVAHPRNRVISTVKAVVRRFNEEPEIGFVVAYRQVAFCDSKVAPLAKT